MIVDLTIVEAGGETGATPAEGTPEPVVASPVPADVAALMDDPEVVALEATDPYNWSVKAINAHAVGQGCGIPDTPYTFGFPAFHPPIAHIRS